MSKAVPVPAPLHRRDDDSKAAVAEVEAPVSIDTLEAEVQRALAPLRARQAAQAAERAALLARSRMVPGAAVIVGVAHPDEGVGVGQIGHLVELRGESALVATKGTSRTIEVLCLLADLTWIPS